MMENFTLIELHLDDARFSNVVGGDDEAAELAEEMLDEEMDAEEMLDEGMEMADEAGSGRGIVRRLVVLGVVVFAARAAVRRMRGGEDVDYDVSVEEMDDVEASA